MSSSEEEQQNSLYPTPCGYFPEKTSYCKMYNLFTPEEAYALIKETELYKDSLPFTPKECQLRLFDTVLEKGFRRSSDLIYREVCPDCKKCVPIRIRVADFSFSKNQRYLLRKNSNITVTVTGEPTDFDTDEKAALLQSYNKRHDPSKNDSLSAVRDTLQYMNGVLMEEEPEDPKHPDNLKMYEGTLNMEYRLNGKLIGCSIVDVTHKSLSSNYFYYDISPEVMKMGLGTFSILKEIEYCKEHDLPFYYLGYWISDCRKMSYKANFKPHELLIDDTWVPVEK